MTRGQADLDMLTMNKVLGGFLAAPPAGTPQEIVALLQAMASDPSAPLPPRVYYQTVEQSPVAISITDPAANILYVNTAFEQLTGYARAEVIGQNESILSSNATPPTIYRELWQTIQQCRTWSGTLVNRTRAGVDYLAALSVAPVLDQDEAIAFYLAMHRDVSHEHNLETALRQQKTRLETVLNAAPVVVMLVNEQGEVILDNCEAKQLFRALQERSPFEVISLALREQAGIDPLAAMQAGDSFKNIEISLEMPDGSGPRWFVCSGTPVQEQDGSARHYFGESGAAAARLLLLANDVSARKREVDRAHLENLRARLAEQRMTHGMREALSAAIYQMQGPLNVIQAALGMLEHGKAETATLATMLTTIHRSGEQAMATLKAALPEADDEANVSVNINELLRQVLEMETDRLLAAGIVVDWNPAPVLPKLRGHKDPLRAMFKHLLDNALIALNESQTTRRELRLTTRAVDTTVEVEIQDNGPGVDPEQRFQLFEPLFVGWRNRRGHAGMGLALSQEIVNQHGGWIEVDRDYRDGCLIRLSLSVLQADD